MTLALYAPCGSSAEVETYVEELRQRVLGIISRDAAIIDALAESLLESGSMMGESARALMQGGGETS